MAQYQKDQPSNIADQQYWIMYIALVKMYILLGALQRGTNIRHDLCGFYWFSNFQFSIQNGPGPTHPLPNFFWMFRICLTLQHPLGGVRPIYFISWLHWGDNDS